jgi:hypothetical protein
MERDKNMNGYAVNQPFFKGARQTSLICHVDLANQGHFRQDILPLSKKPKIVTGACIGKAELVPNVRLLGWI